MRCIEIADKKLVPATRPVPKPKAGELLVKVAAAGVNRPDVLQRKGGYPAPKGITDIPGLEISGTVVALGKGVTGLKTGAKICALVAGGGYAEYCVVPAPQCLPLPKGMDIITAAGVPENYFTVWTNLFDRGDLKKGESILIHGGTSGIGTTAIQVAHAFGAKVFATAGSPDKCRAAEKLGAVRCFDYTAEDFAASVMAATKGKGVDVILDMVGGDYIPRNLSCLATGGRHVSIATQKGKVAEVDLLQIMQKRLVMTGSTLRPRSIADKGSIAKALRKNIWPKFAAKKLKVVLSKTFPLEEAQAAHDHLESGANIGKILLKV
ncbi:MAG TPA: NAD(P)H-quinone oxidoreductase [Verrucomicrobiae bacterium]